MRARLILLLAIMAMGVCPAVAQRYYTPNLSIGAKAGATLGEMSFSPKVEQSFLPGMTFGAVVRYTEEKLFGIQGEINFTQRGWAEKYEKGDDFKYHRTLYYIQIPIFTQIRFGTERIKCIINLGPEVGYMIGDRISADFDYENVAAVPGYPGGYRNSEQLAMKTTNRFDYGIAGGLGMEMQIGKRQSAMLEGRFYYGLGNIFPATKSDYFSASRGMAIEVTLAYLFRLL